jgi:hypothetical protein
MFDISHDVKAIKSDVSSIEGCGGCGCIIAVLLLLAIAAHIYSIDCITRADAIAYTISEAAIELGCDVDDIETMVVDKKLDTYDPKIAATVTYYTDQHAIADLEYVTKDSVHRAKIIMNKKD